MNIELKPLSDGLGVEVLGADLGKPLQPEDFAPIRKALADNSILLFRETNITTTQQIDFSRNFGKLEKHVLDQFCHKDHPEIYIVSNVKENGEYIGAANAGEEWHSDLSYMENPSLGSALRAIEVPPVGGETGFAGMYAAYDALPETMRKRIDNLKAVHSFAFFYSSKKGRAPLTHEQKAKTPDVVHPVVRTNPENGRKAIYVCETLCPSIVGMPDDEGRDLIAELTRFSTQPQFTYSHRYVAGDMILWDNRSAMHRAMGGYGDQHRRVMYRTTIEGDGRPS